VPSSSAAIGGKEDDPAGYNLYRIEGGPGCWRCDMIARGLRAGRIVELNRQTLIG
jgi:hypothetical protein